MGILNTPPNRRLTRSEVKSLGDHESVDGIFPIYGERPGHRDRAAGFEIKIGETAKAIAYEQPWECLETRTVSPGEGIRFDEQDVLEDLQQTIIKKVGVVDPDSDQPEAVQQGLEPSYECPDCNYSKSGLTVSPHDFLDHLQDEHGYSESEASEILHG